MVKPSALHADIAGSIPATITKGEIMFNKKKIKALEAKIKTQENIINRQALFMPAFNKLKDSLEAYDKCLYIAAENESKYIHATMKTVIGMLMQSRTQIITNIRNEMTKIQEFYIENILKEQKDKINASEKCNNCPPENTCEHCSIAKLRENN